MATGSEARANTGGSFAFNTPAPVQASGGTSGQSAGYRVSAGQSQGGANASGPQTNAGPIGAELGSFLTQVLEPSIRRKQEQRFFEGFTAAQSGIALGELTDNDSPAVKIFGPSGYQAGAQFYTGQAAVGKFSTDLLSQVDELKRLSPEELAGHVAQSSRAALTGDPFADQFVQKGVLEAAGPIINTISKERVQWQQQEAVTAQHVALTTNAGALQAIVKAQAGLNNAEPSTQGQAAIQGAVQSFVGLIGKPEGMLDDSYQRLLTGVARDTLQSGNGYAYRALKKSGGLAALTPEAQDKLDELEIKFGTRANSAASIDFSDELIRIDARVQNGELSPVEAANEYRRVNQAIKRSTGFDQDVFDAKDIRGVAHTVTGAIISAKNKADDRAYTRSIQLQDRALDAQEKQQERAQEVAAAQQTWAFGSPVEAIAGGVDKDLIEAQASNDWVKGNLTGVVRTFNTGYLSDAVKASARAGVEASVGEQYNKGFEKTYQQWAALYQAKPAAALAYYGPYHVVMQKFNSLRQQGTDNVTAFSKTFGDAAQYGTADLSYGRRKEVEAGIDATISSQQASRFNPFGATRMGANAQAALKSVVYGHVAAAGNNSATATASLMEEAAEAATISGEYERYGQFAWRNKAGTEPLHRALGLGQRDADAVFKSVYNLNLRKSGIAEDTDPDSIIRYDNNGHPAIIAVVKNADGVPKRIGITFEALANTAALYTKSQLAKPTGRNKLTSKFGEGYKGK